MKILESGQMVAPEIRTRVTMVRNLVVAGMLVAVLLGCSEEAAVDSADVSPDIAKVSDDEVGGLMVFACEGAEVEYADHDHVNWAACDSTRRLKITVARVRVNPIPGRPAAGYLWLRNSGPADSLIEVSSGMAERVEIHTHRHKDGHITMERLASVDVPAAIELGTDGTIFEPGTVDFEPGGLHLMLFGLSLPASDETTIPLNLVFEQAGSVQVNAIVERIGSSSPNP
jgi:periplasmic copper chaperone A